MRLAALLVLAAAAGTARGDVTLCNKSEDETLRFAAIWDGGIPVFADFWIAEGWTVLPPNGCLTVLRGRKRQSIYLSVQSRHSPQADWHIYHTDPAEIDRSEYVTKGWYPIEEFYCVRKGDFRRRTGSVDEHRQCPDGYYQQLFNVLGFATASTDLTLRLN